MTYTYGARGKFPPVTEACHLGNVAFRSGMKLEWNAKSLRMPNAP